MHALSVDLSSHTASHWQHWRRQDEIDTAKGTLVKKAPHYQAWISSANWQHTVKKTLDNDASQPMFHVLQEELHVKPLLSSQRGDTMLSVDQFTNLRPRCQLLTLVDNPSQPICPDLQQELHAKFIFPSHGRIANVSTWPKWQYELEKTLIETLADPYALSCLTGGTARQASVPLTTWAGPRCQAEPLNQFEEGQSSKPYTSALANPYALFCRRSFT